MTEPTTPPLRFRFGLRTLFAVVVIVAVACAWVAFQLNWIRQRHAALRWVDEVNVRPSESGWASTSTEEVPAPWQLRLFGETGVADIWIDESRIEEADHLPEKLRELESLFPESRANRYVP